MSRGRSIFREHRLGNRRLDVFLGLVRDEAGRFNQDPVVGLGIQLGDVHILTGPTGLFVDLPAVMEIVDQLFVDLLSQELFSLTTTPLKTPETLTGGSRLGVVGREIAQRLVGKDYPPAERHAT